MVDLVSSELIGLVGEGYVLDVDLRHLEVTLRVTTSTATGVTELDCEVARRLGQL